MRNPEELRAALLADPRVFVQNVTERLLIYALGRLVEAHDMPMVRDIVRRTAADDYRFHTLLTNIVLSDAFLKARVPDVAGAPAALKAAVVN